MVEMTWVNEEGTKGAETIVRVEFIPTGSGTNLKLNHMGFPDEKSKERHKESWPQVLENLDTMILGL